MDALLSLPSMMSPVQAVTVRIFSSLLVSALALGLQSSPAYSRDDPPKRPPTLVKLCSSFMDRETTTGERCPDGAPVQRRLLIPYNVNSSPSPIELWKVRLDIWLTNEGLKFDPEGWNLKSSEVFSQYVWLQPGWSGLYKSDLERIADLVSGSPWCSDRQCTYLWDDQRDPAFRILSATEPTDEDGFPPTIYVPKSGDEIFFECLLPATRNGKVWDSNCRVRDFISPQHDGIEYSIRYSHLSDWRRYSKWLWDYVDSITVKDNKQ